MPAPTYPEQLDEKVKYQAQLLAPFNPPKATVFASTPWHYRMRSEFRMWHEGDDLHYVMFDQTTKQKQFIEQHDLACPLINQLMPALKTQLADAPILRRKLFQVEFLTSTLNQAVISLIYHRPLTDDWSAAIESLTEALKPLCPDLHLIGRSKKQQITCDQNWILEQVQVNQSTLHYQQMENSFTQPNAQINQAMLNWAANLPHPSGRDLLELYCGNGNFSIALAPYFRQILATELASSSIKSAQFNMQHNQISNMAVARLSAHELTQAIQKVRPFRRLSHVNLDDYDFSTVLVDPPRAGMDEQSCRQVQTYERIIYISCNPVTLARDLEILTQTHRIEASALFDQFPQTPHIESGVYLIKR